MRPSSHLFYKNSAPLRDRMERRSISTSLSRDVGPLSFPWDLVRLPHFLLVSGKLRSIEVRTLGIRRSRGGESRRWAPAYSEPLRLWVSVSIKFVPILRRVFSNGRVLKFALSPDRVRETDSIPSKTRLPVESWGKFKSKNARSIPRILNGLLRALSGGALKINLRTRINQTAMLLLRKSLMV